MSKPLFVFESPIFTRSGYGDWSETIARSLVRYDKFDLQIVPTPWGQCSKKNLNLEARKDDELQLVISKILRESLKRQPDIYCKVSIPNEFNPVGKFNLGMTAGIETTLPAGPWVEGLNRMNFNIVTSEHSRKVFQAVNYTKSYNDGRKEEVKLLRPCEVLFWGIDTSVYNKTSEKHSYVEKILSGVKEDFAFLYVGQWTANNINADRKDIGMLVKIFADTFRDFPKEKRPCLILKTNGAALCKMDKYDCVSKLKSLMDGYTESDVPSVYILHGELTDAEMNALYNHEKVKVHVNFSHGEGFCMPLLEASLSGKPILAPNWSGHLDFLDGKLCKLLPGEVKQIPGEAVNDWFVKESAWFYVNYPAASEIMKVVFRHYDDYIQDAEKLRVQNEQKFSIQQMDKLFHEMLDKYIPPFAVEQKIVLPKLKKITLPRLEPTNPPSQEEIDKMPVSQNS